jgi:hypothetical protein
MKKLKKPELMTFSAGGYLGNHQTNEPFPIKPLLTPDLNIVDGLGSTYTELEDIVLHRDYDDAQIEPLLPTEFGLKK